MLPLRRVVNVLFPVVALLPAVLLLACPGGSSSGGASTAASNNVTATGMSASAVAAASTSAPTASATVDPPSSASAMASTSASATVAAASSSGKSTTAPAQTCGDKPLPACPLKKWMQANSGPAMSAKDFTSLVGIFNRIATMGPPGYGNWASIAKNGAQAATAQDNDGCKAACRQCHDQYKAKFKADYAARSRPI